MSKLDPDDEAVIAEAKAAGAVFVTWDRVVRQACGGITPYEAMDQAQAKAEQDGAAVELGGSPMLTLLDGPAAGTYMCQRAPLYLRAVIDAKTGKKDVLDQLDDAPKPSEQVHVYRLTGLPGSAIVCYRRPARCVRYATGNYLLVPDVDGEEVRDTVKWHDWAIAHYRRPCGP